MAIEKETADEAVKETTESKPLTDLNFLGLDGTPIKDMEVKVTVDGQIYQSRTDERGCLPTLSVDPGLPVVVEVKRLDGSFKSIDECKSGYTDSCKTYTSPALLLEATTELHEGAAGDIELSIPRFEDADKGVVETENSEPPVGEAYRDEGHSHPKYVTALTSTRSAPHTKHLPDPSLAVAPKTGGQSPLEGGRDKHGNPLIVYMEKVRDWWGRWHFWGMVEAGTPSSGTAAISPSSAVTYSGGMQKQVQALIDFATEQVTYDYSKEEGTQVVYTQMRFGTFKHKKDEKAAPDKGPGRCYQWVRVALARVVVTGGYLADEKAATLEEQESASMAGGPLIRKGFKDVTGELPDARWAAAGDVIVYAWASQTWERRKVQKKSPNLPNYGHIDIRSYESYISDFLPKTKHPSWTDYTNIHIYRKIFDPLPTARIRAFLHCLREYECQAERDEAKRYGMLNHALPNGNKVFTSYAAHPWHDVPESLRGTATASGAYQIVYTTWKEVFTKGLIELPRGVDQFSPAIQDRIAVIKLEGRDALHLIRKGEIEAAIDRLLTEWTSLPGGKENADRRTTGGKPMDKAYFMSIYDQYLIDEKAKEKIQ